jgi:glycosyltransferase involved in cell wall biosynthesis
MEHMANHTEHGSAAADIEKRSTEVVDTWHADGEELARPLYHRFSRSSPSAGAAPRVSVVIPTMNEAANLPHVLSQVAEEYEVIVVDGGSTDGTMEVARRLRPSAVVMRQPGRGKGDALFAGFAVSRGDMIVTLDADGSQRASEIESFVEALDAGADFVKGSRSLKGGGSADFTLLRGAGNRALGMAANLMHGTSVTDITYGFNAFWRHCLPYVVNDASGFEGETIMYIRAARAGLRISEVPCYEDRRIHGESNLRTFRDGWRILALIFNERRSEKVQAVTQVGLAADVVPVAGEVAA